MSTLLITGANCGIGLELTREFARRRWEVRACCRNPAAADDLQALAAASELVTVHRLEVTDPDQIREVAGRLKGTPRRSAPRRVLRG